MAYPPHYLLQFGGTVGTATGEIWSCGIRLVLQNAAPDDFDPGDGYLVSTAVPALAAWMTRASSKIGAPAKLAYAKCNSIGPDGRYTSSTTNEYFWPTPVIGGGGGGGLPFQCAVVLSWETDNATRGPASKGRIYSPVPQVAASATTGLFSVSDALGMAQSAATLLNSLDDSVGPAGQIRPAIVSNVGEGSQNEINIVRVDNRVDIQRRRANQLVPVSSVVPFSY